MKTLHTAALIIAFSFASAFSAEWNFDNSHTNVNFEVSHMVISTVTGTFGEFEGNIKTKGDSFDGSTIEFTIHTKSIDTDNDKRDEHLRSGDFFDSEKFPKMTFKSTSFQKVSGKKYKLVGNLTIKDITKKVTLDVKFNGTANDPWGNKRAGFSLSGEIDRYDFGLKWNKALEAGGLLVGQEIEIIANVQLIQKG